MKLIDSHVHIGLNRFNLSNFKFEYDLENSYNDFINVMNKFGIQKSVIFPIPYSNFCVSKSNNYILEAHNKYPDRFIPFCRIDNNLLYNLSNGFTGVKLHLPYENFKIKDLKSQLRLIEDMNIPLIVHFSFKNKLKEIKEILKLSPNIKLIIAHMGRGNIYTNEDISHNIEALKYNDNVYFETSTIGDANIIKYSFETLGMNRIIYGSDYPFGKCTIDSYNYIQEIDFIKNINLDNKSLEYIFYKNIENILYNPKDILIRRVNIGDYNTLNNFLFSNILSKEDIKFLAIDKKKLVIRSNIRKSIHCYVAVLNNNIVGFMRESGRENNYSILEELVVHPDYRKMKIANKMLLYYHRIFSKTLAKTNSKNLKIIKLLEKFNYYPDNINAKRIINWKRNV